MENSLSGSGLGRTIKIPVWQGDRSASGLAAMIRALRTQRSLFSLTFSQWFLEMVS